eukprot:EG_transcript_20543
MRTGSGGDRPPVSFDAGAYGMMFQLLRTAARDIPLCPVQQLWTRGDRCKVPVIGVRVRQLVKHEGDACVLLEDPTGTITGTVDEAVIKQFPLVIVAESALLLQKVTIFEGSATCRTLILTLNNVVEVFPPDAQASQYPKARADQILASLAGHSSANCQIAPIFQVRSHARSAPAEPPPAESSTPDLLASFAHPTPPSMLQSTPPAMAQTPASVKTEAAPFRWDALSQGSAAKPSSLLPLLAAEGPLPPLPTSGDGMHLFGQAPPPAASSTVGPGPLYPSVPTAPPPLLGSVPDEDIDQLELD